MGDGWRPVVVNRQGPSGVRQSPDREREIVARGLRDSTLCYKVYADPLREKILSQPTEPLPLEQPPRLDSRAMDNLVFIRETMERASTFTGVSGWGAVAMGLTVFPAAWLAGRQGSIEGWLGVWLAESAVAGAIGWGSLVYKARRLETPIMSRAGRRFLLGFAPPLLAGAVLTLVLFQRGVVELLPGVWLLLYGSGVVTGSAFSIRVVPLMGLTLLILGVVALLAPSWGTALMVGGFGVCQVGFGLWIAGRYGG